MFCTESMEGKLLVGIDGRIVLENRTIKLTRKTGESSFQLKDLGLVRLILGKSGKGSLLFAYKNELPVPAGITNDKTLHFYANQNDYMENLVSTMSSIAQENGYDIQFEGIDSTAQILEANVQDNEYTSSDIKPIMVAKGINGQVQLFDNYLLITRKGLLSFMNHGFDGGKFIFLKVITAVQYKAVGSLTSGFIQFVFSGGKEDKDGLFSASSDENTVMFSREGAKDFQKLLKLVLDKSAI